MPHMPMLHETNPKLTILDALGDISNVELFHNQVLLATYLRPTKTKSGLILTDSHVDEDKYQSKVGLLVKRGPLGPMPIVAASALCPVTSALLWAEIYWPPFGR